MNEQLLSQNVSLIYDMIRDAVKMYSQGNAYNGLQLLQHASAIMYLDHEKDEELRELDEKLDYVNTRISEITVNSEEERQSYSYILANQLSAPEFNPTLKNLRNYMQRVGYYTLMNGNWKDFYDPSKGRKSE